MKNTEVATVKDGGGQEITVSLLIMHKRLGKIYSGDTLPTDILKSADFEGVELADWQGGLGVTGEDEQVKEGIWRKIFNARLET